MPPTVERFGARLALLSHDALLELAAQSCHDIPAFRREVDAELAVFTPVPDWAVNQVLLSPDLVPQILASLELEDHAAAAVCKAWGAEWKAKTRRVLRPAQCPAPDFELKYPLALAALPGGDRMAIATEVPARVHIVDKEMKRQRTLGDGTSSVAFFSAYDLAGGDDGLYVAEVGIARVRRFQFEAGDTFAVAAEHMGNEHDAYYDLALAPGGVLFVRVHIDDDETGLDTSELLALDALSLAVRFKVGEDVWGGGVLRSLAVCGDELYVCKQSDRSIRVLSLDGKPRRVISSQPGGWRKPSELCCVGDRLYLIEEHEYPVTSDDEEEARARRLAGRRIFVLAPEGRTLQVYTSPRPLEEQVHWMGMCRFDGKLMVTDYDGQVLALQGL